MLTDEGLDGGHLSQVLQQLVDRVDMVWSYGILVLQQELQRGGYQRHGHTKMKNEHKRRARWKSREIERERLVRIEERPTDRVCVDDFSNGDVDNRFV